jgi:hypothetical protein
MPITTRQEFIDYTLRSLGAPVIQINVDPQQVEDRLEESLRFMEERHFDFNQRALFSYKIQQEDLARNYFDTSTFGPALGAQVREEASSSTGATSYFPTGKDIVTVSRVYIADNQVGDYMFDLRYQMTLFDFFGLYFNQSGYPAAPMAAYMEAMSYVKLINDVFNYPTAFTFTKTTERLFLDTDYKNFNNKGYLLVEAYVKVDTDKFNKVWEDRLFKKHFAALVKKQWAQNLMKFSGVPLPGGAQLNAGSIMQDALREIAEVETQLLKSYELPVDPLIG